MLILKHLRAHESSTHASKPQVAVIWTKKHILSSYSQLCLILNCIYVASYKKN